LIDVRRSSICPEEGEPGDRSALARLLKSLVEIPGKVRLAMAFQFMQSIETAPMRSRSVSSLWNLAQRYRVGQALRNDVVSGGFAVGRDATFGCVNLRARDIQPVFGKNVMLRVIDNFEQR